MQFGGGVVDYLNQPKSAISDHADAIGLGIAVLILLIALGSVVAMAVPIFLAVFALTISSLLLVILEGHFTIGQVAPVLGTMIALGVGIDYSLFIVSRHRQNLAAGMDVEASIGRALATSGSAVLFAAITVCIALCGLALIRIPYVTTLGFTAAMYVAVTVTAAMTLLPAMLGLLGHRLNSLAIHHRARARPVDDPGRPVGPRGGPAQGAVLLRQPRHPAGPRGPGAEDRPRFHLRLQRPHRHDPAQGLRPARRRVRRRCERSAARGRVPAAGRDRRLARADGAHGAVRGDRGDARREVGIAAHPQQRRHRRHHRGHADAPDRSTRPRPTLVRTLRTDTIPKATADGPIPTADVAVGGATAVSIDLTDLIRSRLFPFIAGVIIGAFLLLMMVFRSLFVPFKAAVMNLLSIGAAYGFVVAVFQWGWGKEIIGLEDTVPIVAFVPVMMFAILFGLSMDYEVFLLSRIREDYLRTGDSHTSVVNGLASTARVITSAALIMIGVFLSFVTNPSPTVKMIGLGMAVAVFVDATIVRMMLVPATMELAGRWNWWIPAWLDRILPNISVDAPDPDDPPATRTHTRPTPEPDRSRQLGRRRLIRSRYGGRRAPWR